MYTSNIYRLKIYNICKYIKQKYIRTDFVLMSLMNEFVWATVRPLSAVNAHTDA